MLQAAFLRGLASSSSAVLLLVALGLTLLLALIPAATATAATAAAAAGGRAGGISRGRAGRGRPAFTLSVFGLGVGLPDIRMPSSAIEVRLVTQRVIDPIHYGNYCGPSPEITPATGCRHPLSLAALDESDEVCRLHDHFYCKCDSIYTQKGLEPPSSVLISTRSVSSGIRKEYFSKLDKDYTMCIHEADQEMIGRFDKLHAEGRLPSSYWDPVTKWKFDTLLDMFRRNLELDAEMLAIPGQETAVPGAGGGSTMAVVASQ